MTKILFVVLLLAPSWVLAQVGNSQNLLNPNLAEREQLLTLINVDEKVADAIIQGRPYLSAMQLNVALEKVLNQERRSELYSRLFRPLNLNSASEDEIKLVPGMSRRMVHEFEEYRPYASLEQFRREMGKYVDGEEVARLEQFVFVPMNLNTASEDAFKTIPGMSRRMLHEFDEYKPYKNIEQFRREMGKYIDDNEVARLESYINVE